MDHAATSFDEGQSEGPGQRPVFNLPLRVPEWRPVDDESRRKLRKLGLPDIIIDRWSQSQADLHFQFGGGPFDQRLVAQELAEIEERRRIDEMVRQMTVERRPSAPPPAPVAQQAVEEVMPPEYEPPLRAPADVISIEDEAPPSSPPEEQAPLPLDRADPSDIEARNLKAALDLVGAGLPVFPARVYWEDGRWRKTPIIKGWQAVSADPERVRAWWRKPSLAFRLAAQVSLWSMSTGTVGPMASRILRRSRRSMADCPMGPWTIQWVADFISYSANPRASRWVTAKARSPAAASM